MEIRNIYNKISVSSSGFGNTLQQDYDYFFYLWRSSGRERKGESTDILNDKSNS